MASSPDSSRTTSRIILALLSILVLTALVVIGFNYFREKRKNEDAQAKIEQLKTEIEDLEQKNEDFQNTLQNKQVELADKVRLLEEKEDQIKKLLNRLASAERKSKESLDLEKRLGALQGDNLELLERLKLAESQNAEYQEEIAQLRTRGEEMEASFSRLTQENDILMVENNRIRRQGAVLQAVDLKYKEIRKSGKEKQGTEFRRGMDRMNVCFTVLKNPLSKPGAKEVYLVIINPDGSFNTNFTQSYSGNFEFAGKPQDYSAKSTIEFANRNTQACIDYQFPEDQRLERGLYTVDLFEGGEHIGQGAFNIK